MRTRNTCAHADCNAVAKNEYDRTSVERLGCKGEGTWEISRNNDHILMKAKICCNMGVIEYDVWWLDEVFSLFFFLFFFFSEYFTYVLSVVSPS